MAKWEIWKPIPFVVGFLLGSIIMGMLLMGRLLTQEYPKSDIIKRVLERNKLEITRVKSLRWQEGGEALAINMNNYCFAAIQIDKSGTIREVSICDGPPDGPTRELSSAIFDGNRINQVYVATNNSSGGFRVKRSAKSNLWQSAIYGKFLKEGNKTYWVGENYVDIDFDGKFDSKLVWDSSLRGNILNSYVFLDTQILI